MAKHLYGIFMSIMWQNSDSLMEKELDDIIKYGTKCQP